MRLVNKAINLSDFSCQTISFKINSEHKLGFFDGLTGLALVYHLLAKNFKNSEYKKCANELLDQVSENSRTISSLDFSVGFLGIGFGIEWLAQNGFINHLNTDEVLQDIDKALYNRISFVKTEDISLEKGITGRIKYLEKRLLSNNNSHRYIKLSNMEALAHITDDLELLLLGNHELREFKLCDLANLLLTIPPAIDSNINKPFLERILFQITDYAEELFCSKFKMGRNNRQFQNVELLDYSFFAVSYLIVAKQLNHKKWIDSVQGHLRLIKELVINLSNNNQLPLLFKVLTTLSLIHWQNPEPAICDAIGVVIAEISKHELPSSLYMGNGHLLLAELCLSNPHLLDKWHDILLF